MTKIIYYVFVTKMILTKNFVEIFMKKIVKFHDISFLIVVDRDNIFTFKFYFTFAYVLKIKHKLSTIFHFQIDDQIKKIKFVHKTIFLNLC